MGNYKLTVFDKSGETLLDESFEADSEQEAKVIGEQILKEKNHLDTTHRCTSSAGKLILFHR
ncbi:YhzD family protein [Cytobacillus sp. S13-E01]|uniref:YhzD family protein n=1 Tax=Cytobacillus sp. S13-E01 TaxID=3031326 RepID=UPI0023D88C49|nr:YhzD family protein [Cytobacillus sp. S13-E01]MDF0726895.1 YhzD family protein [Cytobacillus sp. S13-E01]